MKNSAISRQITEGNIWKQLLIFFFPIMMGSIFQQMYNTVDTIIVGRYVGTNALAAVGATESLVGMINGFFIGIGSGATVILSQFYGAEDRKQIHKTLHTGMSMAVILGFAVMLTGCLCAPQILKWMKMPEDCLEPAAVYVRIYFAGAVASMIYNMGAGILRAMGDSRRPMIFLMACCVINILADLLFVVVLKMGVAGVAVATVFAQVISALLVLGVLLRLPAFPLQMKDLSLDPDLLWKILGIGIPAGLQFVMFDLANLTLQTGINSFGDVTMASWTALCKTDTIMWMISNAFGMAITTFVGQNFGAQKYRRVRQSVWICMAMSVGIIGLLCILELNFREIIMGIYTTDSKVIQVGSYLISIIVPFNAVALPMEIFGGAMRGTGYSVVPTVISGLCICLFRVAWMLAVLSYRHDVALMVRCYPASWILASSVFSIVYFRGGWLRKRIEQCGMEPETRE